MVFPFVCFISFGLNSNPKYNLPKNDELFKETLKTSNGGIVINNPENKTYTEPMSDYYLPGTYGFESDPNGETPEGWDDVSPAGSFVRTVAEQMEHKKVMQLYDSPTTGYASAQNIWTEWGPQSRGTIEFWFMTTDVYKLNQIIKRDR